jgi:hypothetical protein
LPLTSSMFEDQQGSSDKERLSVYLIFKQNGWRISPKARGTGDLMRSQGQ